VTTDGMKGPCDCVASSARFQERDQGLFSRNLHLSMPKFMPVFIHNLKYDNKIFREWIVNLCKNENYLRIIADTSENHKSISLKIEVDEYDQTKCKICKCKFRVLQKINIYNLLFNIVFKNASLEDKCFMLTK
jgi:hypothetical protein